MDTLSFFPLSSMKKFLIIAGSLSLLLLAACNGPNTASVIPENSAESSVAADSSVAMESSAAMSSVEKTLPPGRVVDMSVEDCTFTPDTLTVTTGENVVLRFQAVTGSHTLTSSELGLDVAIKAGETKGFTIPTDKPGTYAFHSTVPCGADNKEIGGTIIVQ